jgi:hypothetical protein
MQQCPLRSHELQCSDACILVSFHFLAFAAPLQAHNLQAMEIVSNESLVNSCEHCVTISVRTLILPMTKMEVSL